MTAEGIFPKINGDVLYASEANGIYNITGSPLFYDMLGSMAIGADGCIGSLVFTGISGITFLGVSYNFKVTDGEVGDISETSLNKNSTFFTAHARITDEKIISNWFPMNNNGSYSFIVDAAPPGSVIIGSVYVFGGQAGMSVGKSW